MRPFSEGENQEISEIQNLARKKIKMAGTYSRNTAGTPTM